MGILDDAIREHLELIREHGAADSEVQRLEDEAFGPPTRPDEADFPESEEAPAASANGAAMETVVEEREFEDPAVHEDATTLMPSSEASEDPADTGEADAGTGLEEPTGAHIAADQESEEMLIDNADEPAAEVEQEEPAAEEHQILDEPASEVHEEPVEEAPEAAEEGTTLYDQSDELDIDLDLQLDEEAAPAEPASEEHPVAAPEGTTPLEPPIESLDTVEHPFHEEIVDEDEEPHDEASPSDEHAVETPAPAHDEEHLEEHLEEEPHEEDEEEDGEDVLADTPEFLRDAPEDDELWFEQGEPKDFDF